VTGLALQSSWVKIPVAAAVLSWLVSLWRYILVIAYSFHDYETETKDEARAVRTEDAETYQIDAHLRQFLRYAAHMRARVERGTAATIVALTVTLVAALMLALTSAFDSPEADLALSLTADGRAAVEPYCDKWDPEKPLMARGVPDDLALSVVPLQLDGGACKADEVELYLHRGWIGLVREY
jgi:hypothetical protein